MALAMHAAFNYDVPGPVGAVQQLVEFILLEDEEFTGSCYLCPPSAEERAETMQLKRPDLYHAADAF
ncbi:hypothetical protein VE01_03487 [Pseudogymnoascus verrucosus]|uniref:Uncharacterized protein n=1 Tax=Pseudogymnoascus verrucosus TaxID=342668 RepID=A0A1B8GRM9_9PEZI|nr:uncharacterized protein VE01_03487 [Pseudogymnoascus verrucosus]OBT98486.1 hypothetical protein VE01_03487 [Pseudogymnoascus verrucosus]